MADATRARQARRRRAHRRRTVVLAAGLTVAAGGGAVGFAATSDSGAGLRLAVAADGTVTQTISSSGTITSSVKYTPSFAQSGTVKSVAVRVGDRVRRGQTLATLDSTALRAALDDAKATLAQDRQQLQTDEASQADAVTTAFVKPIANGSSGSDLISQIRAAQAAVVVAQRHLDAGQAAVDAAQHTVDTDISNNTELRDAQVTTCAGTDATQSTACAQAIAGYQAEADTLATDAKTLDEATVAQDAATTALDQATIALGALIDKLRSSETDGNGSQPSSQPSSTPSSPSTTPTRQPTSSPPSNGSSSAGSTAQVPSAAQVAADQATVDAAEAEVNVARQNLRAATLTSPATGRVAAVGLTPGGSSAGQTITIVGTGVQGVTVMVPLPQIDQVQIGQHVSVSADGHPAMLTGTVTAIGLVSDTSGSVATFPVTVRLAKKVPSLYDGAGADVVITTGRATHVLTVPNSAIHSGAKGTHTVTLEHNGSTTTVPVKVGLAGAAVSEITRGLKRGDKVVLADNSQSLPDSTTSDNSGFMPVFGNNGGGPIGLHIGG